LAERTLEVVAVIDTVAAPMGIHPVIVGGMAVYFWTARDEFLTYDIDVVMEVPNALAEKLADLGFARSTDRRHWRLEGTEILLEAPRARLTKSPARHSKPSTLERDHEDADDLLRTVAP
jgi:hypothetical protein